MDEAIAAGIYDYKEIDNYHKEMHEKMEEAHCAEQEMALLREKNQLAQQQVDALARLRSQNEYNARQLQEQIKISAETQMYNNRLNNEKLCKTVAAANSSASAENYEQMLAVREQIDFYNRNR